MSAPSAQLNLLPWTSSPEDSPARMSARLGQGPDLPGPDPDCGTSFGASSANSSLPGLSSRTSPAALVGGCPTCGATCGPSGMPLCRFECGPLTWEPGTSGRGSSLLLPTLRATEDERGGGSLGRNAQGSPGLKEILPTLTATSYGYNKGGANGRVGEERHSLESLMRQRTLPTLTARDWRSGGASEETHAGNSRPLNETLNRGKEPAYLNPHWCEIFMAFPFRWSEPLAGFVAPASTRSETASSRRAPKSSVG